MRFWKKITKPKEDLYVRILLWAHGKQETGFRWEEMISSFKLTTDQETWVRKIFLTTNDSDRKFFELLRNDETVTPNVYYYSLNEKGMAAAVNYLGLRDAQKNSESALWFTGVSVCIAIVGLGLTFQQIRIAQSQGVSEQIVQARNLQRSIEFCKQAPGDAESRVVQYEYWITSNL